MADLYKLKWDEVEGATSYTVEKKKPSGTWTSVGTASNGLGIVVITDSDTTGGTYEFRVKATANGWTDSDQASISQALCIVNFELDSASGSYPSEIVLGGSRYTKTIQATTGMVFISSSTGEGSTSYNTAHTQIDVVIPKISLPSNTITCEATADHIATPDITFTPDDISWSYSYNSDYIDHQEIIITRDGGATLIYSNELEVASIRKLSNPSSYFKVNDTYTIEVGSYSNTSYIRDSKATKTYTYSGAKLAAPTNVILEA